jgi:hypothetical protein
MPLTGLLLVYALSQVVQTCCCRPAVSTVEASLALGFAAFGHNRQRHRRRPIYRLISTWGLVPLGWTAIASTPDTNSSTRCHDRSTFTLRAHARA